VERDHTRVTIGWVDGAGRRRVVEAFRIRRRSRGSAETVGASRYNDAMRSIGSTAEVGDRAALGARLLLFRRRDEAVPGDVLLAAQVAVARRQVVVLDYADRHGATSTRSVEPAGLVRGVDGWYLVGWCRLRGAGRSFRLDRVRSAWVTAELVPRHEVRGLRPDVPAGWEVASLES
jgi:predicted DNA-binding transcriptional regulator YafY